MKVLFSSDWQANWHNLDKCETVTKEILAICKKYDVNTFVHCGDLKHVLNPIDVRVVNYAVATIGELRDAGIRFFCLLGNHDKIGMHDTSDDWGPALTASGATVVDKPKVFQLQGTTQCMYMVPYYRDAAITKTALDKFAKSATRQDILVFHDELRDCRFNPFSKSTRPNLGVSDLHPKKYMFCVGGHVHCHQLLRSNTFYVGSPFGQDWGEANDPKGYVLVDLSKRTFKFIESKIPRLYDPSWPNFHPPKKWTGHSVRVHVEIPDKTSNIGKLLAKARVDAEDKYKGATITVLPEYLDTGSDGVLKLKRSSSDEEKIAAYVEHTCPDSLNQKVMTAYLVHQLKATGSLVYSSETVKLLKAKVKNFLCFKKLRVSYRHKGITVITGVNKDWPGRNNGAGKTSFLQIPPVAFIGETLKLQANDAWARRYSKKLANDILDFEVGKHRCRIVRQRRPVKLQLWVDGKDVSTGIGVKGTQQAIEVLTGLSWEVMVNSMYLAQADITSLLTGTDAARKAIFGRFLNLERFAKAKELIKIRASKLEKVIEETDGTITSLGQERVTIKQFLSELPEESVLTENKAKIAALVKEDASLRKSFKHVDNKLTKLLKRVNKKTVATDDHLKLYAKAEALDESIEKWDAVPKGKCPTCLQPVNRKLVAKEIETALAKRKGFLLEAGKKKEVYERNVSVTTRMERRVNALQDKLHIVAHDSEDVRRRIMELETKQTDIKIQLANRKKWTAKKKDLSLKLVAARLYINQLLEERVFLKYASSSFSPGGLPMHIAGYIIPELNSTATKYSDLFSDGEIQVQFQLGEESVDVTVINLHGGENVKDQSRGEIQLASLIVGFALREVIHPANVMILDEPGEGLDAFNASKFAAALKELSKSTDALWVTTHNQHILSELADQRQLVVTKHHGVATVEEKQ